MAELNYNDDTLLSTVILAIVIIILICYFTKTSAMEILIHHFLGRALIVLILIYVSSYNKMVGLLSVLIVILLFISDQSNHNYLEGFKQINVVDETKKNNNKKDDEPKMTSKAIEGRDHIGMEDSIRYGKSSNSIPVPSHSILESEDVLPNEASNNAFESIKGVVG